MRRHKLGLSIEDQQAVDLLLDQGASTSQASDHRQLTRMAAVVSSKRIAAATKVLGLLDSLPSTEPPVDLVARTLKHIDRAAHRNMGQPRTKQTHLHS